MSKHLIFLGLALGEEWAASLVEVVLAALSEFAFTCGDAACSEAVAGSSVEPSVG